MTRVSQRAILECMKKPLEIVLPKSQQNAPFWTPNLLSPVAKGRGISMKRAVLYLRVSTTEQTTANQEHELREIAARMGCEVVRVYRDHGISGAKGREAAQNSIACVATPPSGNSIWSWPGASIGSAAALRI